MITLSLADFIAIAAALITLLVLLDRQSLLREMKRTRHEVRALRKALLIQGKPMKRSVIPPWLRQKVIERCDFQCQYCGGFGDEANGPDGLPWHIDHVIPVRKGGPTHDGNLTLSCQACNLAKGALAAADFVKPTIVAAQSKEENLQDTTEASADTKGESGADEELKLKRARQDDEMFDFWQANRESLRAVERHFNNGSDGGDFHYVAAAAINRKLIQLGQPPRYQEDRPS